MKKSLLLALASGVVFPLASMAILAIIMPPFVTWVVVVGIALVAGGFSALAGHEWYQLLMNVRKQIDKGTQKEFEQFSEIMKDAVERHAQTTTEAMSHIEDYLEKQRVNEAEARQAAMNNWEKVTKGLGSSFSEMLSDIRSYFENLAKEDRKLQERAAKSRSEVIDAELLKVREQFELTVQGIERVFDCLDTMVEDSRGKLNTEVTKAIDDLRKLIKTEARRQQEQKRVDLEHFEKMLELQQKAHDDAAKSSEQLWGHLLDRLENDGR